MFKSNTNYEIQTPFGWKDFNGIVYTGKKHTLKITTSDGKQVICTPEHKLFVNDKAIPAEKINLNDVLQTIDGKTHVVVGIEDHGVSECFDVVDVNNENHSYVIENTLISSNCDELAFVNKRVALEFWTSVFPTLSCLTADTLILTDKGYMKIGDVFSEDHQPGDYFKIEGLTVWGKNGFESVSHGYVSPKSTTIIVVLSNGQRVEVTPEHPLYSARDGGTMVEARELVVGDKLRIDKGMNVDMGQQIPMNLLIRDVHLNPHVLLNLSKNYVKRLLEYLDYIIICDHTDMMNCCIQVLNNFGYDYHREGANKLVVTGHNPNYRTEWIEIEYIIHGDEQVTYDFTVPGTHTFLQNGILGSNTGGSCIITSTPTDDETLFADIWKKATDTLDEYGNVTTVGSNGFKALKVKWDEHPERGEEFKELMIKQFGEEKFRREHELDFISEDETLISPLYLSEMKGMDVLSKTGQVRWYKKLDRELIYLVGYDPSLGTGGDNSAIQIFEFPSMIQVGEWMHNKSDVPTQLKVLKNILGMFRDSGFEEDKVCWTLENNSIGEAPLVLIDEYGEEEFFGTFMREPYNPRQPRSRGRVRKGYNTSNTSKLTACTRLKRWIEQGAMTINSKALIKELKGFVARGRTYKARSGDNDDLVMAMILCVRMAMQIMKDEDEYMHKLGIVSDIDDGDEGNWSQPLPVIF